MQLPLLFQLAAALLIKLGVLQVLLVVPLAPIVTTARDVILTINAMNVRLDIYIIQIIPMVVVKLAKHGVY